MVILVRDVQFQHGEFRVVRAVHALVPEVARELIHAFEPAHDEPLEVQFVGNAQVQWDVERVVVGHKWPCSRAPWDGLQHRRVHFQPAGAVKGLPDGLHDLGSGFERCFHVRVDDEVNVAHAVAEFGIGKGVVHVSVFIHLHRGQGLQRL